MAKMIELSAPRQVDEASTSPDHGVDLERHGMASNAISAVSGQLVMQKHLYSYAYLDRISHNLLFFSSQCESRRLSGAASTSSPKLRAPPLPYT